MIRIRWAEQAVSDVRAIRQYIERDSVRYGRLVAERLVEATARLRDFPRSGRIVPELGRDDVRELIIGEYRIVYRVESQAVTVLTVCFGPRGCFLRTCRGWSERASGSLTRRCT